MDTKIFVVVLWLATVSCHFDLPGITNDNEYVEDVINNAVLSSLLKEIKTNDAFQSDFTEQLYDNQFLDDDDDERIFKDEDYVNLPAWIERLLKGFKRIPNWLKNILQKFKPPPTCLLPKPCEISLTADAKKGCLKQRQKDIFIARMWYQITDVTQTSTIRFPLKHVPWLNQTIAKIQYYYALDPFESRYLTLLGVWTKAIGSIRAKIEEGFKNYDLFIYQEYIAIYNAFEQAIAALQAPHYFGSYVDDPTFTNVMLNNKWQDDDIFVQSLLTGNCQWLIRKVTVSGETGLKAEDLTKQLNPNFDFDVALSKANEKMTTVSKAISDGRLFVLYNEEHNGIISEPDISDRNASDTRTMMDATSPITVLILTEGGELKVAAIQLDYKPDSAVHTPESSSGEWLLAKGMVSSSQQDVCQFKYHLGNMHYVGVIYCLAFRRHFSTLHPLYDVLKYHCEGMVPHISQVYGTLGAPNSFGHKLFAISYTGINLLSAQGYEEREYGVLNFPTLIKKKGLDDKRIKYNPFVQDGELLWDELSKYANAIVKAYYDDDDDVKKDLELQSYANEVSEDGKVGPSGGLGKLRGFPAAFSEREEVIKFLTTVLWRPVIHSSVNYNLAPVFIPSRPSKLYQDTHPTAEDSYPHNLPDVAVAVGLSHFTDILVHFRANRLLDYYDKVRDEKLKKLAFETYSRLQGCINAQLHKRNAERQAAGQLGAQYLMPKWLTSSIHI